MTNNISFHYRTNSVKINDKIFQSIKKNPVFGSFLVFFPNFGAKTFFSRKPGSVMHNFIWVSSSMLDTKTNDAIPKKCLERWQDEQALFYRTLLATTGATEKHDTCFNPTRDTTKNFTENFCMLLIRHL